MQLFVGVAMVELVSISAWHYKLFCTEWKVVKCTSERRKLHIKLLTDLLRRVSMREDAGRVGLLPPPVLNCLFVECICILQAII